MNMIMPGKVMANIDIIPKYLKIETGSRHRPAKFNEGSKLKFTF